MNTMQASPITLQLSRISEPARWAISLYLFLVCAEFIAIALVNDGIFMFTLDDPYIHLALAENILQGHYGVNTQEYSAPSSSILWPLIIAPFTLFPGAQFVVLLFNILLGGLSLMVAAQVLQQIMHEKPELALNNKTQFFLLTAFILIANLVGLVYTGMEHSLQVLVAVIIAWGLIERLQTHNTPILLWLVIILAPLVRYECLAISGAALLFLFCTKEYLKSVLCGVLIVVLLVCFSLFLLGIDLNYLPDSVLAKSDVAVSGIEKLIVNITQNFRPPNTIKTFVVLLLAIFLLTSAWSTSHGKNQQLLSFVAGLALIVHLLAGRVGWYFRYEIYVWSMAMLVLAYVYFTSLRPFKRRRERLLINGLLSVFISVSAIESIGALVTTPLAASNIYHQQYQMHRLITEYYKKPVAVNDLGWTTYKNSVYVLDLWGLGSSEARVLRKTSNDSRWMDDLVVKSDIEMIMVYNNKVWFPTVPDNWIKIAELGVTGPKITSWFAVSIFARSKSSVQEISQVLNAFSNTLPEGTELTMVYQ